MIKINERLPLEASRMMIDMKFLILRRKSFDKLKSNYSSCSKDSEFQGISVRIAVMLTERNLNFTREQVVSVEKKDFNLNWSINLHCQCARLMPAVDVSKIVWWCTVHYKDNWHFNVQSIIKTTYVFNFAPNQTWAILNSFKSYCARKVSSLSLSLLARREIEFREINDIFIVIKKIEILTWLHFCLVNA